MRTLVSILIALAGLSASVAGASALLLHFGGPPSGQDDLWKALLGAAMLLGIILSIVSGLAGFALSIVSLILKCWIRTVVSALLSAAGIGLWLYFLSHKI